MSNLSPALSRNLWIGAMVVVSTITTLLLACATPFPALAAIAALHVRRGEGIALLLAAWIAAQITGFGLLHYPVNADSLGWAVALGVAAVGSLIGADLAVGAFPRARYPVRLIGAYVAAYVAFKAVVLLGAMALGSGWAAFSADVLWRQFVRYGLILLGLVVFHQLLARIGVRGSATRLAHA